MPRPKKRQRLEESEVLDLPDVEPSEHGFTINAEYAKRFEHNKKREELQRLEEKYGDEDDESEEGSSSEDEDHDGYLATEEVDAEIENVLKAIRNKDPRIYDKDAVWYKPVDPTAHPKKKAEKPMYLTDYHRENLLAGHTDLAEEEPPVVSYQQEQEATRKSLVGDMHAAADEDGEGSEDDFMVKVSKPKHLTVGATIPDGSKPVVNGGDKKSTKPVKEKLTKADIANAKNDPEAYLAKFMATRAWIPEDEGQRFTAMDSDDSDDEQRAEDYETAWNMRFEDPKLANEKLQSFSRDVGKYGVRREEKTARQRARDRDKERREAQREQRREEKARLRQLRIEEVEEKVNKIKEAAGLTGQDIDLTQWRDIIDGDFDDDQWDREMQDRFGDKYYAEVDGKPKKPKWDDDIDIGDLVPDFDEEGTKIELSDDEDDDDEAGGVVLPEDEMDVDQTQPSHKKSSKQDREKAKTEAKKAARKQRQQIESMVDETIAMASASAAANGPAAGFRYRETSPTTFGLSTRDILFADDKALNQFAGLKKLAAFRDDEKKKRDKKKLNKKARLRQWRRETFGNEDGPQEELPVSEAPGEGEGAIEDGEGEQKKKKRRRKGKKAESEIAAA